MNLNSRFVAVKTLEGVLGNRSFIYPTFNRYASDLPKREKAFAYNLIQGTLRHLLWLDFIIQKASKRSVIDYRLENILRIGVYQLLYMNSVPDYAATSTTCELAKVRAGRGAAAFANATMRNVIRLRRKFFVPSTSVERYLELKYSFPRWIVRTFLKQFGQAETERILMNLNTRPKLYIRLNKRKATAEELLRLLRAERVRVEAVADKDGYFVFQGFRGDPSRLTAFRRGYFILQDPVFAIPPLMLCENCEGGNYLEIGSSPGGKLTHIAELVSAKASIIGLDLPPRIPELKANLGRLGFEDIYIVSADGKHLPFRRRSFARILIDAPCSSLGIIKRHPEIRYIKAPVDIRLFAGLQREMVYSAYRVLKSGGMLIYSTCTLTREENEDIVSYAEKLGLRVEGSEKFPAIVKSLPGEFDGAFVARLRKVS